MRKLNRVAVIAAASTAMALIAPAAAMAGKDSSGAWCKQRAWWDPRWPDCPVNFSFRANGEYVEVQDGLADGHSAVLRIWVNGDLKPLLWASGGQLSTGSRNMAIAEGAKMKFQMCTGEWRDDPSARYLVECDGDYYYGTA